MIRATLTSSRVLASRIDAIARAARPDSPAIKRFRDGCAADARKDWRDRIAAGKDSEGRSFDTPQPSTIARRGPGPMFRGEAGSLKDALQITWDGARMVGRVIGSPAKWIGYFLGKRGRDPSGLGLGARKAIGDRLDRLTVEILNDGR